MRNLIARLRARSLRGDRGAASLDIGLVAVLVGVTAVAATTLIGFDVSSW